MNNQEIEQKIRSIIHMSTPVLEWVKGELENDGLEDTVTYVKTVQSLIAIEELKKLLESKDPNSSKRFKQTKIKF